MNTRVKQILSATAGMSVAMGLVWGFHTYLQSHWSVDAPPVAKTRAVPAPQTPAAPAAPTPVAPAAPTTPVATTTTPMPPAVPAPKPLTANELVCQGEAARTSDPVAAEALYRKALAAEPDHPFARSGLILSLTAQKKYADLATLYTALLTAEPTNKKYLYNLAVTQTRMQDFLDAEATYKRLLTFDATNRIAQENYANILATQGKYSGAIVAWSALTKLQSADKTPPTDPYMQIGRLQLLLKQTTPAKAAFLQVLEIESSPKTRTAIAAALSDAGHHGLALAHLSIAVKLDPNHAPARREEGNIFLRLYGQTGDKQHLARAIHSWQTSLRLNRNQPKLKTRLTAAKKKLAEAIVTEAQGPPANR